MKKTIGILLIVVLLSAWLPFSSYAHPGKTDSAGGHYDHDSGSYHYHHGYPAHSHTNGECPYDYEDKTDHSSKNSQSSSNKSDSSSSNSKNNSKTTKKKDNTFSIGDIFSLLFKSVIIFFALSFIYLLVGELLYIKVSDKISQVIVIFIGIASIFLAHIINL